MALEDRRSWMDKEVTFTKRGLVDYIEHMLASNNPEKVEKGVKSGWDEKAH